MLKLKWIKVSVFATVLCFLGCDEVQIQKPAPDIGNITVDADWIRLDALMAEANTENIAPKVLEFIDQYPDFGNLYFGKILPLGTADDNFNEVLVKFRNDEKISELLDTTLHIYPNLDDIKAKVDKALAYHQYYFPKYAVPNFYTFISEYAFQAFIFNDGEADGVGLGLDMFLGEDYDYKSLDPKNPSFSEYLTSNYKAEYIPRKAMQVIVEDQLVESKNNNFLDNIIKEGKKIYLLSKLFPNEPMEYIMEYSKPQWDWCEDNELQIWDFFNEKELVFETSIQKVLKYILPSPGSQGMPEAAPGQTGVYIGFKMIEDYMRKNSELSLDELINLNDSQLILSDYKPKRK